MSRTAAAALAAALSLSATIAVAHPKVISSTPAADAQVSASPTEIRIKFNEAPFAKFSSVEVKSAAGHAVKTGKTTVNPKDKTQLVVPVAERLTPGVYKVSWKASGSDTHKVEGGYSFTVK